MQSALLTTGRRLALALEPGDDVLGSIAAACREHGIAQAVIVTCSGAFRRVRLIAAEDDDRPDPEEPMPDHVDVAHVEGIGSGTVTSDADGEPWVHLHLAAGVRGDSGRAVAGHVVEAESQYVVEVALDEVLAPRLLREASAATRGVPALRFAPEAPAART